MSLLFLLSALLSEIIGTLAGFGSSTVFLPLALLFFEFKSALVLVAFLHVFGNLGRVSFFRHGLDRRLMIRFGLPSVILTLLGAALVAYLPQILLKGILGVFLIIYSALFMWRDDLHLRPTVANSVLGGGLSGFLAGLIGTGGALRGAFLTAFNLPKERYIATAAAIAIAVDLTRIPVYLSQNFLDSSLYWYLPVLFILAIAGSFIGRRILDKIPQKLFRRLVLAAILLVGLKFVLDMIS